MTKELGLLGVIFALVPGYIADLGFRACWGMAKGDELDRSLRAVIWGVLGVLLYASIQGHLPGYVSSLVPGGHSPAPNWRLASAFGAHVALSSLAAFIVGLFTASVHLRYAFEKLFGRSPVFESPWDALWSRYDKGRNVRIITKSGRVYIGRSLIASHRSDSKEIVLYDPSEESQSGEIKPIKQTRILYVAADELVEIHLSLTAEEMRNGNGQASNH